jgi:hypothetical protein
LDTCKTFQLTLSRYEIHSSVFLYKAHACGAISSGKHVHTASLMERFISVLKTAAVDESHIAARYARLLDRLWFRRAHRLASVDDSQSSNPELRNPGVVVDTLSTLADLNGGQMPFFDDLGLQPFDCTDTMDGLFAMPSVVSWDPSSFLNTMA